VYRPIFKEVTIMQPKRVVRISILTAVILALAAVALIPATPAAAGPVLGFDVRFTGVVQTVGGEGAAWVIGGQTLSTDAETQVIEIVPPAVGVWADVAAKRQTDGSLLAKQITVRAEQPRLRGPLQSKPADDTGEWVIAGITVNVTAETKFGSRGQEIKVGGWVEAVMAETNGVLTASNIIGTAPADAVIVNGELQAFDDASWTLSSMVLKIDPSETEGTLISGTPVLGLVVHAAAQLAEDNSLTAQALRVSWIDKNTLAPLADFTGVIGSLPPNGLRGEWTVDGQTVVVMPNTRIHQEKGLAVVGATVHVTGWQTLDKIIAGEITVVASPDEGGVYVRFGGLIQTLPEGGKLGEWVIGGQKVLVTSQTQVLGAPPTVGKPAGVEGVKRTSDGVIVAASVRVRFLPPRAQMPVPIEQ
jgi:hypothetical protein